MFKRPFRTSLHPLTRSPPSALVPESPCVNACVPLLDIEEPTNSLLRFNRLIEPVFTIEDHVRSVALTIKIVDGD